MKNTKEQKSFFSKLMIFLFQFVFILIQNQGIGQTSRVPATIEYERENQKTLGELLSNITTFSDITCGNGLDPHNSSTKDNGENKIQSVTKDTSDTTCCYLADRGTGWWSTGIAANDKKCNDTLRLFIEQCGSAHIIDCFGYPSDAFTYISDAVDGMDTANSRWLEYRQWLFKVLYYNHDTVYYCRDVDAMFHTFNYIIPGKGIDYNGEIALFDYLIGNNRCPDELKALIQQRAYARSYEVQHWRDTVHDSVATLLDTAAITIDQIGFSILRGQDAVAASKINTHGLGNFIASKNPFSDETILETILGDAMMFRLEIFDVLGKPLYTENRFFSAGDVRWILDAKGLPEGSLYARISTIEGDVRTIKLIRKK